MQASGGSGEDLLLAYELEIGFFSEIYVRAWRTVDGDTSSLGGGCGRGGTNRATCARSPNAGFAHRLLHALPNAPTVFVLSAGQAGFPCGVCNLIPNLAGAITLVVSTDVSGNVRLPVAIQPSSQLIGVPLFTQWATVTLTSPACSLFSLDMSNAVRIVIQG